MDAYVLHGLRSGAAGVQDPCQGLKVPRRLVVLWDINSNCLSCGGCGLKNVDYIMTCGAGWKS